MVLGFKTIWNGQPTYFVDKILALVEPNFRHHHPRPKIHTIRKGQRWKKGMLLHMATGVRTPQYEQFNQGYPELERCTHEQKIEIKQVDNQDKDNLEYLYWVWDRSKDGDMHYLFEVHIDGRKLLYYEITEIAVNDGFEDAESFFRWFGFADFTGQLVHWTDKRY